MAYPSPRYTSSPSKSARDRDNFVPRSSVTFGEVVSSFNKYGNVASKRHGCVYIAQHTHLPDNRSTIHDKTVNLKEPRDERDQNKLSLSSLSRATARSRTCSPSSARRPGSLPATPRTTYGAGPRLAEPRSKEWMDAGNAYGGTYAERAAEAFGQASTAVGARYVEPVTSPGYGIGTSGGLSPGGPGGTHGGGSTRSLGSYASAAAGSGTGGCSGACPGSYLKAFADGPLPGSPLPGRPGARREQAFSSEDVAEPSPLRPPPLTGSSFCAVSGSRTMSALHDARDRNRAPIFNEARPTSNPRVASFVRLNGFLLRTHITSLISALAEDGWLEVWEKERLCSHARESDGSHAWAQTFLKMYTRFMETDDVPAFVAGLRSQICL